MKNRTCIIIGNGPSLADVPIKFLDKYDTFGANRIYLHYTPTYFVAVNPLVIEQYHEDIAKLDCEKYIRSDFAHLVPGCIPLDTTPQPVFCRQPPFYEGYTVTFVSMQLAFYYGYQTVLLVGVDHRYKYVGGPNEEHVLEGNDPNHFDPDYFKGARWNNPDLAQSERSYRMARTVYKHAGRKIINLGPDSELDIFEIGDISDWM